MGRGLGAAINMPYKEDDMKNDNGITSKTTQQIIEKQPEQNKFYTIEQELTFEERYSPEIRRQLREVDIEIIIQSCPARIILIENNYDQVVNK